MTSRLAAAARYVALGVILVVILAAIFGLFLALSLGPMGVQGQ